MRASNCSNAVYCAESGTTLVDSLSAQSTTNTAAVVVQSPNFFGCIEDLQALSEKAHANGALLIVAVTEAMSFGLLRSPGACGADIVVAEGQSFGVPMSFGGPYVGLFATRDKYARQIPGRLVGEAYDKNGRRGFVLTLGNPRATHPPRESDFKHLHQRRIDCVGCDRFTSRPWAVAAYRKQRSNARKKLITRRARLRKLAGYSLPFSGPFFNEFVVRAPADASSLLDRLARDRGIDGGIALSRFDSDSAQ